ncbi:MAG: hypothetical protein CMJ89_11040 [Planctomycetes bacterium]|jgi:hypothetical protein|nr:hypothetical protein [Planctomycetota bacterium]
MQTKGLLGLALVTAGAAIAVAVTLQKGEAQGGPEDLGLLFEGLDDRINDVATFSIMKEGETLTLERSDEDPNEWLVSSIGGYPAKYEPVKKAVVRLANMAIQERKTNKPTHFEKLGVTEPEAEGSTSRRITVADASGNELASVILGETTFRGRNPITYVRRTGEERVYLCDGKIDAEPEIRTWIDTVALRLENDRIQEVTITHADGEILELGRDEDNHTQFRVKNLPPGRELSHESVANGIATALSSLSFDEVRPADEIDFQAEPLVQARYLCHDGLVLTIEMARADDKTWARLRTSYEAPPAPPEPAEETEDEEAAEASPDELSTGTPDPQAIRAEAEEMATRHALWAYALPSYKADAISKRMEDLLAKLPEPAVAPERVAPEVPGEATETFDFGDIKDSTDNGEG